MLCQGQSAEQEQRLSATCREGNPGDRTRPLLNRGLELFEYIGELKETNFEVHLSPHSYNPNPERRSNQVESVDVQRARHKKYKMTASE